MPQPCFLPHSQLSNLVVLLQQRGYRTLAPQLIDNAILYRPLDTVSALPQGIGVEQEPGGYRTVQRDDERFFAWANGPQALKPLTFAAEEPLWQAQRANGATTFSMIVPQLQPTAVLGVRSCDIAALKLQEAHFLRGVERDEHYALRRGSLFIIAVNCSHPAATCFCASTGDGPSCTTGFDLLLDELDEGFVIQSGSGRGADLLAALSLSAADEAQLRQAGQQQQTAIAAQTRYLPSPHMRNQLFANLDHPRWQEVAQRCLSCGNCTSVCPTCFCHSELDEPALSGETSNHLRRWDSCFTAGHSYIHGVVIRAETAQRYRQWLTHKLGSWHDQYGRSGCVGCGRCIAWCPVGIDITEEVAAICGECAP